MHLSSEGGGGNGVGGGGGVWGSVLLRQGSWRTVPETGQVTLSDQVLGSIVNTDPVEKWYKLDREPIARGQFATVYHCQHRSTGEEFAVKFASRRRLGVDATPDIVHEIAVNAILAPCTRNVGLRDVFTTDAAFVLIMEYAPGGDLQTLLDENLVPYERDVVAFLRQLLEGLVFIHDRGIVHLDIKPQNLVLMGDFPDCAVKLCDFEISRMLTPGYEVREILGTPDYVAPEILHYEAITTSTDMWSLGVLTYVLLTGFLPFGGDNDQETFMQISRGELDFPNELFEDITPEAIDFMKKLLIREPGKRMSARECLCHPWIKKHMTRVVPLSTLDLHTTPVIPQPHTPPVCRAESSPSVIVTTTTETNTETSDTNDLNTSNANEAAPEVVSDSPCDEASSATTAQPVTGRPPLHPRSSLKSMSVTGDVATAPVTATNGVTPLSAITPFLNKESRMGSRQNLNRLRSLSKSREVLSERIQMSNLKKTLSKSRERLYDAKLGMSASREHLNCKSLSQSVEALTALTQLHQNGALYSSCNNIFIPMINIVNKQCGGNMPNRMYQSLASINQIPGNDLSKKMGYFESRFTTDDDYTDLITRRNTSLNMVISNTPADPTSRLTGTDEGKAGSLRGNPCRGGRGAEGCDRVCTRHGHKQPEPQSTRKLSVTNKANKMKKDAQKRRKERKERELREIERNSRKSVSENKSTDKTPNEGSASPQLRKGSVCHVEQRLQERHERLLEKQEREARKLSVSEKRRLNSDDREPSQAAEKTKLCKKSESQLVASGERKRSITVGSRRKSSADSPKSSDVSEASSMESITGSIENIQSRENGQRRKSKSLVSSSIITNTEEQKNRSSSDVNDNLVNIENSEVTDIKQAEKQEPEEQIKSQSTTEIFSKLILADSTKTAADTQLENQTLCVTVCSPTNSTKENFTCNIIENVKSTDGNTHEKINKPERRASLIMSELAPIKEENGNGGYGRTTSTSSDVGSTISEESEENNDQVVLEIESKIAENKARSRSLSVQPKTCHLVVPRTRTRSYSVHQSMEDKARPWGDVCSGSIAKALKNFSMQEDSSTTVTKTSPDPATRLSTLSLPPENDSE